MLKGKCLYKAPPQTAPPTTDPGSVDEAVAIKHRCLVEFRVFTRISANITLTLLSYGFFYILINTLGEACLIAQW